jgi:hypothetical protein
MKYANAISPDRMNAAGRVNNPINTSTPPTSSMMPATPNKHQLQVVEHRDVRHVKQLGSAVLQEQEGDDDAQQPLRARNPNVEPSGSGQGHGVSLVWIKGQRAV